MEGNDLINFNSSECCLKMPSPLLKITENTEISYISRLLEADNNPFDKVLRITTQVNDPFECISEKPDTVQKSCVEDKENIANLLSPFIKTMSNSKKSVKLTLSPLHLNENVIQNTPLIRKDLERVYPNINSTNSSPHDDINDSSLQFFDDSIFTNLDFEHQNSGKETETIDLVKQEKSVLQETNIKHINSLDNIHIRNIFNSNNINDVPKVTSTYYTTKNPNIINKAFIKDSFEIESEQPYLFGMSMSATKAMRFNYVDSKLTCRRKLNNSFSGFNSKPITINDELDLEHDCVSIEMAKMNKKSDASFVQSAIEAECNLDRTRPPWIDDKSIIILEDNVKDGYNEEILSNDDKENIKNSNHEIKIIDNTNIVHDQYIDKNNKQLETPNKRKIPLLESPESILKNKNDLKVETINADKQSEKNLLQSLTDILQCDVGETDKRKLGENLINTIALALNIETNTSKSDKTISCEINKKVSDEKVKKVNDHKIVKSKNKLACIKNLPFKFSNADKSLKVKPEKEKLTSKGPLKAVMPVKEFLKTGKLKSDNSTYTPTKINAQNKTNNTSRNLSTLIAKSSTPKLKEKNFSSPMAQSTPNNAKPIKEIHQSPTTSRILSYKRSTIQRPSSTSDLNRSVSPRNLTTSKVESSTGSPQNLSHDKLLNTSIRISAKNTFLRRKSASDLKVNNNLLQKTSDTRRSLTGSKLPKVSRSNSFQIK